MTTPTFTTAEGLRLLLLDLAYAGPEAWQATPETSELMTYAMDKYAGLANKYGLRRVLILGTLGYAAYSASLYVNNFTTIGDLQADGAGEAWQLGQSILEGPSTGGFQLLSTAEYYNTISDQVESKSNAGYETTLTDIWYVVLRSACLIRN